MNNYTGISFSIECKAEENMEKLKNTIIKDLQHQAYSETRIVIANGAEKQMRVIRRSESDGTITIEHRQVKDMPFQVKISRG